MARYAVFLTEGAEGDLSEIHRYVARADSPGRADALLETLVRAAERLATSPERGRVPDELESLGIREYRQVTSGPYRLIYRVIREGVFVYLIADGRRDMQSLLRRRLLRS